MSSQELNRRLCWIYPERNTARQVEMEWTNVWGAYRDVATELGIKLSLHKPEDFTIDGRDPKAPQVFLNGERITPQDTMLITTMWGMPHQMMDMGNQVFIYTILERLGFYRPIESRYSLITNDKLATFLYFNDCPIPGVPSIRIGTGRDSAARKHEVALEDLTYPVLVKPAHWSMGQGVCLARNLFELRGLVGMAAGSDTALIVQPYLGEGVSDFRIYVVDGQPHSAVRRTPQGSALTAGPASGGQTSFVPVPDELKEALAYLAEKLPMPYFTADFLYDGTQFWLSEIESDGGIGFPQSDEDVVRQRAVIKDRFLAYRRGHDAWLAADPATRTAVQFA